MYYLSKPYQNNLFKNVYQDEFHAVANFLDGSMWHCDKFSILTNCKDFNQDFVLTPFKTISEGAKERARRYIDQTDTLFDLPEDKVSFTVSINKETKKKLTKYTELASLCNSLNKAVKVTVFAEYVNFKINDELSWSLAIKDTKGIESESFVMNTNFDYITRLLNSFPDNQIFVFTLSNRANTIGVLEYKYLFQGLRD